MGGGDEIKRRRSNLEGGVDKIKRRQSNPEGDGDNIERRTISLSLSLSLLEMVIEGQEEKNNVRPRNF